MTETRIITATVVGGPDDGEVKHFRVPDNGGIVTRIRADVEYMLIYVPLPDGGESVLAYHPAAVGLLA